jgi:hypothetical protein
MPAILSLIMLLAAAVKTDQTPLRDGCSAYDSQIASLPAGAPLTIRYSISGESVPCFKVSAEVGGKMLEGFLPASAIDGLEDFDKGKRDAVFLDTPQSVAATRSSGSLPSSSAPAGSLAKRAIQLIDSNHPQQALDILEPELQKHHDPNLLALAGEAAWRADDSRRALEYWHSSLEMVDNPQLEALYKKVERESKNDQSGDRIYGMRVLLRYESSAVSADTARQMATVLDQQLTRISMELGCSVDERMVAIAQSPDAYRKTTNAAEWSGGQFDGRIRVPVFDGRNLSPEMWRTLAHETAHACISSIGQWPAWVHEGIAQYVSGDRLSPEMKQQIADLAAKKQLPRLDQLGQNWSRMDTLHAQAAYGLALAAIELFSKDYAAYGLRNLLRNPERLPEITADLNRKLGLE